MLARPVFSLKHASVHDEQHIEQNNGLGVEGGGGGGWAGAAAKTKKAKRQPKPKPRGSKPSQAAPGSPFLSLGLPVII